jgi:hypothetical protein
MRYTPVPELKHFIGIFGKSCRNTAEGDVGQIVQNPLKQRVT